MSLITEYLRKLNGYSSSDFGHMIPNWKNWLITAGDNKNIDAMNIIGYCSLYYGKNYLTNAPYFNLTKEDGIKMLENSAVFGSIDAMLSLANLNTKGRNDLVIHNGICAKTFCCKAPPLLLRFIFI
jgi:hypothetical protein